MLKTTVLERNRSNANFYFLAACFFLRPTSRSKCLNKKPSNSNYLSLYIECKSLVFYLHFQNLLFYLNIKFTHHQLRQSQPESSTIMKQLTTAVYVLCFFLALTGETPYVDARLLRSVEFRGESIFAVSHGLFLQSLQRSLWSSSNPSGCTNGSAKNGGRCWLILIRCR